MSLVINTCSGTEQLTTALTILVSTAAKLRKEAVPPCCYISLASVGTAKLCAHHFTGGLPVVLLTLSHLETLDLLLCYKLSN